MNIENGDKVWRNPAGQLHRLNGPAIEYHYGLKVWYLYGQLHRTDGPAIEYADGDKRWFIYYNLVSKNDVETHVFQLNLKVLLLSRTINPFCEINVAKYAL